MRELKLLTHTFSTPKTLGDGSYTSRINQLDLITYRNTFCTGNCDEATSHYDLCPACELECFEYKESKNEM